MPGVVAEIESHVFISHLHGLCGAVNAVDQAGIFHGVYREPSRIAEHIQNASVLCEFTKEFSVLPLVYKETGFLAANPVDPESETVFRYDNGFGTAMEKFVFGSYSRHERNCRSAFVIDGADLQVRQPAQYSGQLSSDPVHANRVRLHNDHSIVIVGYKSGQTVPLSMYQSEDIQFVIACQTGGFPEFKCTFNGLSEETDIRFNIGE